MIKSYKNSLLIVLLLSFLLSACGTLEIGIENNFPVETAIFPPALETPQDTELATQQPEQTQEASLTEEQLIIAALEQKLGQPAEELGVVIDSIDNGHASGGVSNGFFLAAKQGDNWVIVHDGQATPLCKIIDQFDFSIEMVPECLDEANQVLVRTGELSRNIGDALAAYSGMPREEVQFTIMQDAGSHIMGYLPGGYFLAAFANGEWQVLFAGNGTPFCGMVEVHNFPAYMVPECMDANNNLVYRTDSETEFPELQSLACGPGSPGADPGSFESVACNIQDALRSRNISTLLRYMEDPFLIGYWLSEGMFYSPNDFLELLPQLYNFNDPNYAPRLTFTMDRSQFPELDGRPHEDRMGLNGVEVEIIYSQGWGFDGSQEALIYLTQQATGDYKWNSMLYGDFDAPVP